MKYHLEIDKNKRAVRFTKLLSKDATYLKDSYYCTENRKWYLVRRQNMLPEIVTVVVAVLGMLAIMFAGALIGRLIFPNRGEFTGITSVSAVSVFASLALYRWLPTVWLSKGIGIELEECDQTQAAAQHEQYLAAAEELDRKGQVNRELVIVLVSSMLFMIVLGTVMLLLILKSQGRL